MVDTLRGDDWEMVMGEGLHLPLLPVCMQSTPSLVFFSFACRDLMLARVSIGLRPEFSARAMGTASNASAKARIAYCSRPGLYINSLDIMKGTDHWEYYLDCRILHC